MGGAVALPEEMHRAGGGRGGAAGCPSEDPAEASAPHGQQLRWRIDVTVTARWVNRSSPPT